MHDWEQGNYIENSTIEGRVDWDELERMEHHAHEQLRELTQHMNPILGWTGGVDALVTAHLIYNAGLVSEIPKAVSITSPERFWSHQEYCYSMAEEMGFENDYYYWHEFDIEWVADDPDKRLFPALEYVHYIGRQRMNNRGFTNWFDEHPEFDCAIWGLRHEHNNPREQMRERQYGAWEFLPIKEWDIKHVVAYLDKYNLPISPQYRDPNPVSAGPPWWRRYTVDDDGTEVRTMNQCWWQTRYLTVHHGYAQMWDKHILKHFPEAESAAAEWAASQDKSFVSIDDGYNMGANVSDIPADTGWKTHENT